MKMNQMLRRLITVNLVLAMFLLSGMFVSAQNNSQEALTDITDYHQNTNVLEPTYVDYVTQGGGLLNDGTTTAGNSYIPYFVMPDPALNIGYYTAPDNFDNSKMTSSWTWSITGGDEENEQLLPVTYTDLSASTDTLNQVILDAGSTVGSFVINVAEEANPIGCAGQTRYINVEVIPYPAAVINNSGAAYCSSDATSTAIVLTLTGRPPFHFTYTHTILERALDGSTPTTTDTYNVITGSADGAVESEGDGSGTLNAGADANTWTYTIPGAIYNSPNGLITVHTIALDGVNGAISRKSDRMADDSHLVYLANDEVVFTSYPAPNTGDIYSIPN